MSHFGPAVVEVFARDVADRRRKASGLAEGAERPNRRVEDAPVLLEPVQEASISLPEPLGGPVISQRNYKSGNVNAQRLENAIWRLKQKHRASAFEADNAGDAVLAREAQEAIGQQIDFGTRSLPGERPSLTHLHTKLRQDAGIDQVDVRRLRNAVWRLWLKESGAQRRESSSASLASRLPRETSAACPESEIDANGNSSSSSSMDCLRRKALRTIGVKPLDTMAGSEAFDPQKLWRLYGWPGAAINAASTAGTTPRSCTTELSCDGSWQQLDLAGSSGDVAAPKGEDLRTSGESSPYVGALFAAATLIGLTLVLVRKQHLRAGASLPV
eukprot:TRINITY_DN56808_c0_g1_i1.p1 TRINITY_DN56808_c0_g1~~TRINITY_DN56808_c0_g1_i1.p1  ORF type:complete len:329 (+),score=59.22 TRINITY_DN56808_c0_g1_i1:157-1143(+)